MSAMARRLASLLLALLAIGSAGLTAPAVPGLLDWAAPSTARADGDPASDVLLGESVFYPFTPAVGQAVQNKLNGEAAAAKRAGFPLKVAIIGSPIDLGSIPQLFGKPQEYASFLDKEISFEGPQPVLIVMAAGYGIQGVSAAAQQQLRSLPRPAGRTPTALAQAAIVALPKLAAAAGHPLGANTSAPRTASGARSGSSRALLLGILLVAAVIVAMLLLVLRSRDLLVAIRGPRRGR